MSFLFPLYLLGALAIALPVLLHLRKRPPKEKIPFGSLIFLEKSPEKLTRRTRIERWLLLALRCLALIVLALVFGRPFMKSAILPSELPESSIAVILVDRSASMQREDLAEKALAEAEKAVRARKLEDDVAVLFFDRETRTVAGFEEWNNLDGRSRASDLRKRARDLPNGWDIANTGKALIDAVDRISARGGDKDYREKDVVLISDFKEGADFNAMNQFAWPDDIVVECVRVAPRKSGNLSLTLAASSEESRSAAELIHRVRIANSADSESDRFALSWKGNSESTIEGVVPPGASRVIKVQSSTNTGNASELVISGDSHDYDNTVYIAPPSALPLSIEYISGAEESDQVGSPYFYLKRALHPTASLLPSVSPASFDDFDEESAAFVIHGEWSESFGEKANQMAQAGKLIVALPTEKTSEASLAKLLGVADLELKENIDEKYAMLADLDFEHPVLAPFARARIRDFTKIRFWNYRKLKFPGKETPDQISVLAKFDSGTPAWLSKQVGEGSIFVFLSGWEPKESQFALSSKFVPVLYSIFENAGYSAKSAPTYYIGEVDILNPEDGKSMRAKEPGLFQITTSNGGEAEIGVNLHPSSSRVDSVDPDHLLGDFNVPLKSEIVSREEEKPTDPAARKRLEIEEKEANQKLWKWLVLAVLCFLIGETWLSGRSFKPSESATA